MKLQTKKLIAAFAVLLIISTGCRAQDKGTANPEGCSSSGYKFSAKELVLNNGTGGELNLYLLNNISEDTIYMNHEPKDNPGASAGWSTELAAGNWTAISISEENFAFTCGKMVPGRFQEVPCSGELDVCKFTKAGFSEKAKGSYWVSENKTLDATLETIKSRGIEVNK